LPAMRSGTNNPRTLPTPPRSRPAHTYPLLVGLTFILNSWNCLETKKDPNKPKMARSIWIFFRKLNRGRIRELNAHLGSREVEKICSEEFAALDGNGKKKYADMRAEDYKRFVREMEAYDANDDDDIEIVEGTRGCCLLSSFCVNRTLYWWV
jgi:hypothetical protein